MIKDGKNGTQSNETLTYVQESLWGYMKTWFNKTDSKYGMADNWIGKYTYSGSSSAATSRISSAKNYASNLATSTTITATNNTNTSNLTANSSTYNGTKYLMVGPFSWNFGGTLQSVTVNGSSVSGMKFAYYDGTSCIVKDSASEISSTISGGRNFYLLIPESASITSINKVSASFSATGGTVYKAKIWFLYRTNEGVSGNTYQKVMLAESSSYKSNAQTSLDMNVNVESKEEESNLQIKKVDSSDTSKVLNGVQFVVRCTSCSEDSSLVGKWLMLNNGAITYSSNSNIDSFIKLSTESERESKIGSIDSKYKFTTNSSGYVTINNIKSGTYEVIEILNPNTGYSKYPIQKTSTTISSGATKTVTIKNSVTDDDRWRR